ncbi:MAG: GNAT family N-acetyltransferase [Magnetococcales bacterium]|nr:GNAT family N-acetyltransferase [Magnetococcales bacterium]
MSDSIQNYPSGIKSRPFRDPDDLPLLYRRYASTRWEELALTQWSDEEKNAFLNNQFRTQHQAYMKAGYANPRFDILELDRTPIGRLYISRGRREIRIIDIALLPDMRNRGYGKAILQQILKEGQDQGTKVSIHVESNNPAMQLYLRLGFAKTDETGVYHQMEWVPHGTSNA